MIQSSKMIFNETTPCKVCGKPTPQSNLNTRQDLFFCSRVCEGEYFSKRNPEGFYSKVRMTDYDFNSDKERNEKIVERLKTYGELTDGINAVPK